MIDRVCLGRCFSYANYEPSTAQFRIRTVAENPYVTARYEDSWRMQNGSYVVQRPRPAAFAVGSGPGRPDGGPQFESRYTMWKHIAEGITGFVPPELNRPQLADWPWRKILADAGLARGICVDFLLADAPVNGGQPPICPGATSITIRFQTTSPPYQYEIQRMT